MRCTSMSSGDAEFLYPRMNYDGERYQLQFENGLLTGYTLLGTGACPSLRMMSTVRTKRC